MVFRLAAAARGNYNELLIFDGIAMSEHPGIRFCTTPDGVRLAMAMTGNGPPLLRAGTWFTHVEQDMDSPLTHHWIADLSRGYTYVRYDSRGCGLSDHDVGEISLEAWVADLETVADAADLQCFPLIGISCGVAVAIEYAVRHPERVSQLICYGGFARGLLKKSSNPKVAQAAQAMLSAAKVGWGSDSASFRQVFISQMFHDATADQQRMADNQFRHNLSGENAARYLEVFYGIDVRDAAIRVHCPTLVFHAQGDPLVPFDQGRELASLIPGARLVVLQSKNHVPFANEAAWSHFASELHGFLRDAGAAPASSTLARAPDSLTSLTSRQREVLKLVASGQTDKQIAKTLDLSPRTVEMHVANTLLTLQCHTRAEAVRRGAELGLLGLR